VKPESELRAGTRFYPSIFIGVGGVGTTIVEDIYRRLHSVYEGQSRALNTFQFLAIDTRMLGQQEAVMPVDHYRSFGGFDGREWVRIRWPQDKFFRTWWWQNPETGQPYRSKFNDRGAGARRIDGRLCLLANMATGARIDEAIKDACDRATDVIKSLSVSSPSISVYICNSLSGGTGSGIFIDLAFLLRDRLARYRTKIYGFLLTPDVVDLFANDLQKERRVANAYAALTELSFWQSQQRGAPYRWAVAGREVINEYDRPFDLVHIIDTGNKENKKINNFKVIREAVTDMIYYLAIGQASEEIQSPLDNLPFDEGQECFKNPFTGELRARTFGSGAVASIRFPIERLSGYMAGKFLVEAARRMKPETRVLEAEAVDLLKSFESSLGPEVLKGLVKERLSRAEVRAKTLEEQLRRRRRDALVSSAKRLQDEFVRDLRHDRRQFDEGRYAEVLRIANQRLDSFILDEGHGLLSGSAPRQVALAHHAGTRRQGPPDRPLARPAVPARWRRSPRPGRYGDEARPAAGRVPPGPGRALHDRDRQPALPRPSRTDGTPAQGPHLRAERGPAPGGDRGQPGRGAGLPAP